MQIATRLSGALLGLAAALLVVSLLYQRFVFRRPGGFEGGPGAGEGPSGAGGRDGAGAASGAREPELPGEERG